MTDRPGDEPAFDEARREALLMGASPESRALVLEALGGVMRREDVRHETLDKKATAIVASAGIAASIITTVIRGPSADPIVTTFLVLATLGAVAAALFAIAALFVRDNTEMGVGFIFEQLDHASHFEGDRREGDLRAGMGQLYVHVASKKRESNRRRADSVRNSQRAFAVSVALVATAAFLFLTRVPSNTMSNEQKKDGGTQSSGGDKPVTEKPAAPVKVEPAVPPRRVGGDLEALSEKPGDLRQLYRGAEPTKTSEDSDE